MKWKDGENSMKLLELMIVWKSRLLNFIMKL